MPFRTTLILILVLIGVCGPVTSQELETRAEIDNAVLTMFINNRFAELEDRAAQYRETGEQTSSGLQKLNLFYFGLESAVRYQLRFADPQETTLRMADEWMAAYPTSPTAAVAKAVILYQNARAVRTDRAQFLKLARQADAVLLQTKHYAGVDPHWYTLRAEVLQVVGAAPDVFAANIEEGLDRHPGYYQLYFAAVNYLSPQWNGNRQMIEAFVDGMVDRTRDTEGEGMYARIYWYVSQVIYGNYLFLESDAQWDRMRVGIMDVIDRYPDQWNIQNFAFFACLAEDAETLAVLLAMMQDPPIMQAWQNNDVLVFCRMMVAPI